MGYDEYDYDYDAAQDRADRDYHYELAGHNQDARDNDDCLALAVDYLTTKRRMADAYAARDAGLFKTYGEHFARVQRAVAQWSGLEACILRGDYGR